mmetsp:Transcript_29872/g.72177  ORF Transcript_29872/g.72177 Transcript_29872/m.72177 type:complete len:168 (-) Transcript_29872:246-749(-)
MKLLNAAIIAVIAAATPSKASAKKLGGPTINKERKVQDEFGLMPSTTTAAGAVEALSGGGLGDLLAPTLSGFFDTVNDVAEDVTAALISAQLKLACDNAIAYYDSECSEIEISSDISALCLVSIEYMYKYCFATCYADESVAPEFLDKAEYFCCEEAEELGLQTTCD